MFHIVLYSTVIYQRVHNIDQKQIKTKGIAATITLVRHKKARFDSKMHGSTQKSPVRHNNALPSMHQLTLPLSTPPPPPVRNIFSNFIPILCFLRNHREMKIIIIMIIINLYCRLPKYMARYTEVPIFKYIVYTMIMKNYKKGEKKYMWEIHMKCMQCTVANSIQ